MYAVITDQHEQLDALRHVFFAESARDAALLAREIADEDGLRALVLKVIDAVDPEMPSPSFDAFGTRLFSPAHSTPILH